MNDEYLQGFIQKCAEAGVDPGALLKDAGFASELLERLGKLLSFNRMRTGMGRLAKTTTPNMDVMQRVWKDPELAEKLLRVTGKSWRDILGGGAQSLGLYGGLGAAGLGAATAATGASPDKYLDMYRQ